MIIDKVFFKGVEQTEKDAQKLYEKYVRDYMTRECFWGGVTIQTPDGELRAEVRLE